MPLETWDGNIHSSPLIQDCFSYFEFFCFQMKLKTDFVKDYAGIMMGIFLIESVDCFQ